jgi:class 3 adenylate cyclase
MRRSPVGQEGERRQITVFFSDLSGYTALTEQLDHEDVRAVMDRVFSEATAITERSGGRIDRIGSCSPA